MHIKYGKSAQGPRTGGIFTPSVRGSFGQAIQGCRTKNRLLQLPHYDGRHISYTYNYNGLRTAADPSYASPLQTVHGPGSQQRCAQGQDVLVEYHLRIVHGLTVAGILLG